jgi:hypothetical protein
VARPPEAREKARGVWGLEAECGCECVGADAEGGGCVLDAELVYEFCGDAFEGVYEVGGGCEGLVFVVVGFGVLGECFFEGVEVFVGLYGGWGVVEFVEVGG